MPLRLARTEGEPVGEGLAIKLRLSQQSVGDLIGVTRQTAMLCLHDMRDRGLIAWRYGRATRLDMAGLQALAASQVATRPARAPGREPVVRPLKHSPIADTCAMHRANPSIKPRVTRRDLLAWLGAAAWPAAPALARPLPTRVVVLSDFNGSYGSVDYIESVHAAVRRTIALRPDLVISTGDMIAGQRIQPRLTRDPLVAMWDAFHRHVTTPLQQAGLPLAVTPGNHDGASGSRFALEREVYREQWLARRPALDFVDARGYPFDYAFRLRGNLFVSIDATFVGPLSPTQRAWVEHVLREGGRDAGQRIVFSHVPLWPFAAGRERDYLGDRQLEAILQRGHVGMVLSGHHHAYYPGFKDGVRYVSQGCLGAAPRPLLGTTAPTERTLTLLELDADGGTRIEAYGSAAFDRPVARESLPREIRTPVATLLRDDLAPVAAPR